MTHARPPHFPDPRALFETFIISLLLNFQTSNASLCIVYLLLQQRYDEKAETEPTMILYQEQLSENTGLMRCALGKVACAGSC
jgi:hypothetical protein